MSHLARKYFDKNMYLTEYYYQSCKNLWCNYIIKMFK